MLGSAHFARAGFDGNGNAPSRDLTQSEDGGKQPRLGPAPCLSYVAARRAAGKHAAMSNPQLLESTAAPNTILSLQLARRARLRRGACSSCFTSCTEFHTLTVSGCLAKGLMVRPPPVYTSTGHSGPAAGTAWLQRLVLEDRALVLMLGVPANAPRRPNAESSCAAEQNCAAKVSHVGQSPTD